MAVFQDIYESYSRPVYRFLLSLTGDETLAEELLQETFYQTFLHIDRFEGRSSLFTWLCQIGKNAWLKECKRKKRFVPDAQEAQLFERADGVPLPEEIVIRKEQYKRLRSAVYHLEEPYREVFIMHVFGERKLKDIALLHHKSESWAKVTYYRAKAKLAAEMEEWK